MAANLLSDLDGFYNPHAQPASTENAVKVQTAASASPPGQNHDMPSDALGGATEARDPKLSSDQDDLDDEFGEFQVPVQSATALGRDIAEPRSHPVKTFEHLVSTKPKKVHRQNPNVLFDADDEPPSEDENDFGDFEQGAKNDPVPVNPIPSGQSHVVADGNSFSLIDIDPVNTTHGLSAAPDTTSTQSQFSQPSTIANSSATQIPERRVSPKGLSPFNTKREAPLKPDVQANTEWDDFETTDSSTPISSKDTAVNSSLPCQDFPHASNEPDLAQNVDRPLPFRLDTVLKAEVPSSPQANIPPPSILLSLFPSILESTSAKFFEPISQFASDPSTQEVVYAHAQVQDYLHSLLCLGSVLARIIAGRKSRWKRDKILAQSMSISQASAGGRSGGMKLAGLDKAENAREERDVADAVRSWRTVLGRLRSAVNSAGKIAAIPEVKEEYLVRTALAKDGAIIAPKQCILCGLKRNERIVKVDADVQDSFGEWWVEHWGHRDCARFWQTYENKLQER